MNILFIGDIVGRTGRNATKTILPDLIKNQEIDFVIANGENLASGKGMTLETYDEMTKIGIDYFTSGNHIWSNKDFVQALDQNDIKVLRPANYPDSVPGRGYCELKIGSKRIVIINLIGRVFISESTNNPFLVVDEIIKKIENFEDCISIVDFHAEATSEKTSLGYYLDGRVTAVLGTHTHIPTSDGRILPQGTAYISDAGMVGALNSAIGVELESAIKRFLTGMPAKLSVEKNGPVVFSAVKITVDSKNRVSDIELIQKII